MGKVIRVSQQACKMNKEIRKQVKLDYLLYLPQGYEEVSDKKWPMILFLHGAGECGENIEMVKVHGIPKVAEAMNLPFICVSPQCPSYLSWDMEIDELTALIDEIIERYSVDTEKIYITGLSMGGYGTWNMAMLYHDRIAAIAPICGGGDPEMAHIIKDIPVWAFHGAKDNVVPIKETEDMVNALKKIDGNVKFTVYPEAKHNCWTETYNNPELYEWFLSNSKKRK